MTAALQDTLANCIAGENDEAGPIIIKNRLDELDKELAAFTNSTLNSS